MYLQGLLPIKPSKYILLLLILFFSLTAQPHSQEYIVGESDVLRITVYEHPDLTTIDRVTGKGTITFPLIGQIKVEGFTVPQISQKISVLLADGYIINPQVTVFVQEFRSNKASIIGQIVRPGLYELSGQTTFLELLSKAGGLTRDAGDRAVIKRKSVSSKKENIIMVDLKGLIEAGDTSLDVLIIDGDSIYIPKADVFYVTGEVKKPDSYTYEEGTTIIKAVTLAGGFTDKASTTRVKIIRKIDGKEEVLKRAKMDEPILPDDVIVVPESFF